MELSIENIAFIGILFVALVGIWALVRSNNTIANLIPVPLAQELIKSAVNTALDLAEQRAATTVTPVDDEFVKMIREEVKKAFGEVVTEAAKQQLLK